tara:strand:- start:421 stop:981 length:561 start_codon:yes stop_codon:yes gene_type:complete
MVIAKATHKPKLEIVANPRQEKNITPKQEEFCQLYVSANISQTECALKAGYSPKSAHTIASQLLNPKRYPYIADRIRELKNEHAKNNEITFESHVKELAKIRDAAFNNGNYPAAVTAEKSRGQAAGLYIDRKEILHGRIDKMSRDEVMREITKLQEEFPALAVVTDSNLKITKDLSDVEEAEIIRE